MFEQLFYKVLEQYIGAYVLDLNRDQLKVGVLKGKIVLRNVKLKPGAFDYLDLPITVKEGYVDELVIKVPWTKLSSESVSIHANGVSVLVCPLQDHKSEQLDDSEHWTWNEAAKKQRLRANELLNFVAEDAIEESPTQSAEDQTSKHRSSVVLSTATGSEKLSRKERILARMLDNISVTMNQMHIRYMDSNAPGQESRHSNSTVRQTKDKPTTQSPIIIGMIIETASLHTTDAMSQPAFVDRHKHGLAGLLRSLSIQGLSVYCVDQTHVESHTMNSEKVEPAHKPLSRDVILDPVTANFRLLQTPNGKVLKTTTPTARNTEPHIPNMVFHGKVGKINSHVNPAQVRSIVLVVERMTAHSAFVAEMRCREHRPRVSIKTDPRAWWQYAASAVTILLDTGAARRTRRKSSTGWRSVIERIRDRSLYVECYRERLILDRKAVAKSKGRLEALMHKSSALPESANADSHRDGTPTSRSKPYLSQKVSEVTGMLKVKDRNKLSKQVQLTLELLEEKLPLNAILLFRAYAQGLVLQDVGNTSGNVNQTDVLPRRFATLPNPTNSSTTKLNNGTNPTPSTKNPAKWFKQKASNVLKRRKERKLAKLVDLSAKDVEATSPKSTDSMLEDAPTSKASIASEINQNTAAIRSTSLIDQQILFEQIWKDVGESFGSISRESTTSQFHLCIQSMTLELKYNAISSGKTSTELKYLEHSQHGLKETLHLSMDHIWMEGSTKAGTVDKFAVRIGSILANRIHNDDPTSSSSPVLHTDHEYSRSNQGGICLDEYYQSHSAFETYKKHAPASAFRVEKNAQLPDATCVHTTSTDDDSAFSFAMRCATHLDKSTIVESKVSIVPVAIVTDFVLVDSLLSQFILPNVDASLALTRVQSLRESTANRVSLMREQQSGKFILQSAGIKLQVPVSSPSGRLSDQSVVQFQFAPGKGVFTSNTDEGITVSFSSQLESVVVFETIEQQKSQSPKSLIDPIPLSIQSVATDQNSTPESNDGVVTQSIFGHLTLISLPTQVKIQVQSRSVQILQSFGNQLISLSRRKRNTSKLSGEGIIVPERFEFHSNPATLLRWKNEVAHKTFGAEVRKRTSSQSSVTSETSKLPRDKSFSFVEISVSLLGDSKDTPSIDTFIQKLTFGSDGVSINSLTCSLGFENGKIAKVATLTDVVYSSSNDGRNLKQVTGTLNMERADLTWNIDPKYVSLVHEQVLDLFPTSSSNNPKNGKQTQLLLNTTISITNLTVKLCNPISFTPIAELSMNSVRVEHIQDHVGFQCIGSNPSIHVVEASSTNQKPMLYPSPNSELSKIQISLVQDAKGKWKVESHLDCVEYHHIQQVFKELLDFVDVCIRKPIVHTMSRNGKSSAVVEDGYPRPTKFTVNAVVQNSTVRFTPQRSHFVELSKPASVSVQFETLSVNSINKDESASSAKFEFEGTLSDTSVVCSLPGYSSDETILNAWTLPFTFTTEAYRDPNVIEAKKQFAIRSPYHYVQGIRSEEWYGPSTGGGNMTTLLLSLPGEQECCIGQSSFHLLMLVIGETLGDWRRQYWLPSSLPEWAKEVGSDVFNDNEAKASTAFDPKSNVSSPDDTFVPPEFTFRFQAESVKIKLVPDNLKHSEDESFNQHSVVRFQQGVLQLEDSSQRGRDMNVFTKRVTLDGWDMCAEKPIENLICASGMAKRNEVAIPSLCTDSNTDSNTTWKLNQEYGVQLRFQKPSHGFCELRTVFVPLTVALIETVALQRFIGYFNGTSNLRSLLGCPETIGLDPATSRRPRTIRWEFFLDSCVGLVADELRHDLSNQTVVNRQQRLFQNSALQVVGTLYGNLTKYPTSNQIATLSGSAAVALLRAVRGTETDATSTTLSKSWLVRDFTPIRIDVATVQPAEPNENKESPVQNLSLIVAPLAVGASQNEIGSIKLVVESWLHRYQYTKKRNSRFKIRKRSKSLNLYTLSGITAILNNDCGDYTIPVVRVCLSKMLIHVASETVSNRGRRLHSYSGIFMDIDPTFPDTAFAQHKDLLSRDYKPSAKHHIRHKGVYVSYYNINIVSWEPLLEPFAFEWKVQKQGNTTSVMIESAPILNLNCTYAGIDTLLWLQSAQAVVDQSVVKSGRHFGHYVLNATGSDFGVVVGRLNSNKTSFSPEDQNSFVMWVPEDGQRIPLNLRKVAKERRISGAHSNFDVPQTHTTSSRGNTKKKIISIVWKGEAGRDWYPVENIDVEQVGTFVYPLYPRYHPNTKQDPTERTRLAKVVVDITTVEGSVYIRVSSAVEIGNHTSLPIEVLLMPVADSAQLESGGSTMILGPIPPGGKLALPIHAVYGQVSVRPEIAETRSSSGRGSYSWWEGVPLTALSRYHDRFLWVECERDHSYSQKRFRAYDAFVCGAIVHQHAAANDLASNMKQYIIDLVPTIHVENLLPVTMHFELFACVPTPRNNKVQLRNEQPSLGNGSVRRRTSESLLHQDPLNQNGETATPLSLAESTAVANDDTQWSSIDSVRTGTLRPGEEAGVLFRPISPDYVVLVSMRVEGSTWSRRWPLVSASHDFDGGPMRSAASVVDREKRTLTLMVETSRVLGSAYRISPFVSAWFINRTDLGLSYRAGKTRVLDDMNKIMKKARSKDAPFRRGQGVQVRLGGKRTWHSAIVLQVNNATSFDVLYENDEVELNVDVSLIRVPPSNESREVEKRELTEQESNSSSGDNDVNELDSSFFTHPMEQQAVESGVPTTLGNLEQSDQETITMFSDSSLLSVRVTDSKWSKAFNLDSVGTQGSISMMRNSDNGNKSLLQRYEIGAAVQVAPAPFQRTKVITFVPRFRFVNCLGEYTVNLIQAEKLETAVSNPSEHKLKEIQGAIRPLLRVPPQGNKALHCMGSVADTENYFCLSLETPVHNSKLPPSPRKLVGNGSDELIIIDRNEWSWSGRFKISSAIDTAVKLLNRLTGELLIVRISIELFQATAVVTFAREHHHGSVQPLYMIRNRSTHAVHMFQNLSAQVIRQSSQQGTSGSSLGQQQGNEFQNANSRGRSHSAHNKSKCIPAPLVKRSEAMTGRVGKLKREAIVQRLLPGDEVCFGWDEPEAASKFAVLGFDGDSVCVNCNLEELGQLRSVVLPATASLSERRVRLKTTVQGSTRLLEITDEVVGTEGGLHSDNTNNQDEDGGVFVQVSMTGVGVSLVDSFPQELLYVSLDDLTVDYLRQPGGNRSLEVFLQSVQVDNQLLNARLPVALSPTWKSTSTSSVDRAVSKSRTFFHLSATEIPASHGCRFIEYFAVLIQEMDLMIEEALFLLLWRFVVECSEARKQHSRLRDNMYIARNNRSNEPQLVHHLVEEVPILSWLKSRWEASLDVNSILQKWQTSSSLSNTNSNDASTNHGAEKWYFERIHLHPLKANVTFQRLVDDPVQVLSFPRWKGPGHADSNQVSGPSFTSLVGESNSFDTEHTFDPRTIISLLPPALPDVEGAQFRLNALIFENAFVTQEQLVQAITQSYVQQGLSQIYKIIGSAEILGNPIGLVTNLGSGVRDFFYEPAQGFVQSPQDFGEGIARGTRSLVHHTAFGTFDSVSKLSGAIGTGFATLSLDNQFLSERRSNLIDNVPKHIGDGVLLGAQSLGDGIFSGITGIVMQPIRGAEEEGVNGFFKGVGKGILGAAVRPAVGVFDMVARMFAGMRSTAAMLDSSVGPSRLRLPRMIFSSDRRLRTYSAEMAFVQELLLGVWGFPKFQAATSLIGALPLEDNLLLVVTPNRVTCVDYSLYRQGQQLGTGKAGNATNESVAETSKARPVLVWEFNTRAVLDLREREGSSRLGVILSTGQALHADRSRVEVMMSTNESGKCVLSIPTENSAARRLIVSCVRAASMGELQRKEHYIKRRKLLGLVIQPIRRQEASSGIPDAMAGAAGAARAALSGGASNLLALIPDCGVGVIERVAHDSLSQQAGLRAGDFIVGYGGRVFETHDFGGSLFRAAELIPGGAVLDVMIWRQGKWLNFDLKFPTENDQESSQES